ncbi:hypothetical protein PG996_015160 [Apiospora saccharicola]|uniref:SET domain-containing protein n=1 Tax=Apiospora saccharicola TaxID=335842 RepID=A0ABR1TKC0_9PEZI
MDEIEAFIHLAERQGVQLYGIEPARIPGRGVGVIATRSLKTGEAILNIPMQAVRSLHSISETVSSQLPAGLSFHGVLAADLALDKSACFASWKKLLPTRADFAASMPFTWPEELQKLLPRGASDIVHGQHAKFKSQWGVVAEAFPSLARDEYMYFWLLVNTRTFYLETPEMKAFPWDDRLALLPIADLFNHADQGCHVTYSAEEGYTITASRRYKAGEEVLVSYGDHSNDLLLAEYGFVMAENKWDSVCLDEVIMPRLNQTQKKDLESNGHGGPYMLDSGSEPSRHLVVVSQMLASSGEFPTVEAGAQELLNALLSEALETTQERMSEVHDSQVGEPMQRDMLYHRWQQIESIILRTIDRFN